MSIRIATIQHGDYRAAVDDLAAGKPETYFGMRYTVDALGALFGDRPHLVVSLNGGTYEEQRGAGRLVAIGPPRLPRFVPRRLGVTLRARRILAELDRFRPTHLIVRTGGQLARELLAAARERELSTLVVFANVFAPTSDWDRRQLHAVVEELNRPQVFRIGNHRWPATQSLLDFGVNPEKAVAYDYPGTPHPRDHEPKSLRPAPHRVVFVGTVSRDKGAEDVAAAVVGLRAAGRDVSLTVAGDGPAAPALRDVAARAGGGAIELLGKVAHDRAFALMRDSDLVCVPSRHNFPEGMPQTLTEGLASRTPVIASDHPIFRRAFTDGEGMRFFPAADPVALGDAMAAVLDDAATYRRLSETTRQAYEKVECTTYLHEIFDAWRATF